MHSIGGDPGWGGLNCLCLFLPISWGRGEEEAFAFMHLSEWQITVEVLQTLLVSGISLFHVEEAVPFLLPLSPRDCQFVKEVFHVGSTTCGVRMVLSFFLDNCIEMSLGHLNGPRKIVRSAINRHCFFNDYFPEAVCPWHFYLSQALPWEN